MRGTKAKRLRALAREATKYVKATAQTGPGTWRWLTGYRRVYQDSKRVQP